MQTYLSDIIPSLSRYSKQLNDETLLTSRHWVVIDEIANRKNIYIYIYSEKIEICSFQPTVWWRKVLGIT
jgi:hypothetical protein